MGPMATAFFYLSIVVIVVIVGVVQGCVTQAPSLSIMKTGQPVAAHARIRVCAEDRVGDAFSSVSVTELICEDFCENEEPVYVFLPDDIERIARKRHIRGEYFCYLAVHPNSDRKKNTFLGVTKDPLLDLYRHNHADAFYIPRGNGRAALRPAGLANTTKGTHAAAPYWSMASALGPFVSKAHAQTGSLIWSDHTRGDPSKNRKARVVADIFDIRYYGRDVPIETEAIVRHLQENINSAAASLFAVMQTQLDTIEPKSVVFPGLAILDELHAPLLGSKDHNAISFVRPVH